MLLSVIIALAILNLSYMFVASAIHKLRAPLHFQQIVRDYQLVPATATAIISKNLPRVEIAVGLALLAGSLRSIALAAAAGLLLSYTLAMGINIARGRRDIDCGCNGPMHAQTLSVWLLVRNTLLLMGITLLWQFGGQLNLAAGGWTLALAGSALLVLLYQALNQLHSNNQLIQRISRHG